MASCTKESWVVIEMEPERWDQEQRTDRIRASDKVGMGSSERQDGIGCEKDGIRANKETGLGAMKRSGVKKEKRQDWANERDWIWGNEEVESGSDLDDE